MTTAQLVIVCTTTLLGLSILAITAGTIAVTREKTRARAQVDAAEESARIAAAAELAAARIAAEASAAAARIAAEAHVSAQPAPAPSLVGRTIVVHTRKPDDQTVRGVVHGDHADGLVLRDGVYLHGSGEQAAAGLLTVPRINVSSWQQIESPKEPA